MIHPADTDHDQHGNRIKLYYSERQRLFELRVAEEPTREEAIDFLERLGRERVSRLAAVAERVADADGRGWWSRLFQRVNCLTRRAQS